MVLPGPARGTNIYWVSIAAVYPVGQQIDYPWGWKTRLRDPNCLAPDAAVASDLASPVGWSPIQYPPGTPWDMAFELTTKEVLMPTNDFGDAPGPYPTMLVNNGARHTIVPGILLGRLIDAEFDGQPDATATGDDNANLDDEEGVILPMLVPGQPNTVSVTVTGSGLLSAWIDFGADGSWAEAGDQILADVPLSTSMYLLNFNVPSSAVWGATTFARFRFSTVSSLSYTGVAPDG